MILIRYIFATLLGLTAGFIYFRPASSTLQKVVTHKPVEAEGGERGGSHDPESPGKETSRDFLSSRPISLDGQLDAIASIESLTRERGAKYCLSLISGCSDISWKRTLTERVFFVAGQMDVDDAEMVLKSDRLLSAGPNSQRYMESIWQGTAKRDPAGVLDKFLAANGNENKVRTILNEWGSVDYAKAKAFIDNSPIKAKQGLLNDIAVAFLRRNPKAALAGANAASFESVANLVFNTSKQGVGPQGYMALRDPAELGSLILADHNLSTEALLKESHSDFYFASCLRFLSQKDSAPSFETLTPFLGVKGKFTDEAVLDCLVQIEGNAVENFNKMFPQPTEALVVNFLKKASSLDFVSSLDLLETRGSMIKPYMMAELTQNAVKFDPELAVSAEIVSRIPAELQESYKRGVAAQVAASQPKLAWQMLDAERLGPIAKSVAEQLVQQLGAEDFGALLQKPIPDNLGLTQAEVVMKGVEGWVKSDPLSASQWVNLLEPGSQKDDAIVGLIGAIKDTDPASANIWAKSISNPKTKEQVIGSVLKAPK